MNFLLKPKFLIWVIAILIVINISTFVGVMISENNKKNWKEKQREAFFNNLKLSDKQRVIFVTKRKHFQKLNNPLYNSYDSIMVRLQHEVAHNTPNYDTIRYYTDSLGHLNTMIRRNWVHYYIDVRKHLSESQKVLFDSLTMEHLRTKMEK